MSPSLLLSHLLRLRRSGLLAVTLAASGAGSGPLRHGVRSAAVRRELACPARGFVQKRISSRARTPHHHLPPPAPAPAGSTCAWLRCRGSLDPQKSLSTTSLRARPSILQQFCNRAACYVTCDFLNDIVSFQVLCDECGISGGKVGSRQPRKARPSSIIADSVARLVGNGIHQRRALSPKVCPDQGHA